MGQSQVNVKNMEFNGGSSQMLRKMGTQERAQLQGVLRGKDQAYAQAQQENAELQAKLKALQGSVSNNGQNPGGQQKGKVMSEEEKNKFKAMRKRIKKQNIAR